MHAFCTFKCKLFIGRKQLRVKHLCQNIGRVLKIIASFLLWSPGQEVLYEADTDVVAHLLQLLVDLLVCFVVPHQLGHHGSVGQGEQLPTLQWAGGTEG